MAALSCSTIPGLHMGPACLQVELSQEDLTMLLRIPLENLGEADSLGNLSHKQDVGMHLQTSEGASTGMQAKHPRPIHDIPIPASHHIWCVLSLS